MGKTLQGLLLAMVLSSIALAFLLSACGSSSSSSSSPNPTKGNAPPAGGNGNPLSLGEKGGAGETGASSFIKPNSPNNKYATFGTEASSAERAAASAVLAENLEAREAADFATQCATLSLAANEEIAKAKNPSEARALCAGALKKLASPLNQTKEARADNFNGQIAAFRVRGTNAYALYHGTDGIDWLMPMVQEGGTWKATSVSTIEV